MSDVRLPSDPYVGFIVLVPSFTRSPPPVATSPGRQDTVADTTSPVFTGDRLPSLTIVCNSCDGPSGPCGDELGVDQYQLSGEHPFYQQVDDKILRPLGNADLIIENENNNFTIKPDSKLHDIYKKQLKGKAYISCDDFWSDLQANTK